MTGKAGKRGPVERAQAAWGADMPEWIGELARACAASSQNRVAKRLGRSGSLVSQVLARCYDGDMKAVEELFNGAFRDATVECPALGRLPTDECHHWRERARSFESTHPFRAQMFRACNRCPRNQKEKPSEHR